MATKTKKTTKKEVKFDFKSIKTFADACKKLGIDPKIPYISDIPEEFKKPMIAYYKLQVIYKVINNGWKPDWGNYNQYKYYPWYGVLSSGFGFSSSFCIFDLTDAPVGSRLCTDSVEKALFIAQQFEAEYKDYFLYSE